MAKLKEIDIIIKILKYLTIFKHIMIISHSKKFIFIRSRKTAGSSIGLSLLRYLSSGDIVRGYIESGFKYGIKPPDWNKSLLYLRPKDFKSNVPRVKAYNRFVKIRTAYNVSSTHMSAKQIKELVGCDVWEKYFTFTIERNPFERMISFYFWRIKDLKAPPSFNEFIDSLFLKNEEWLKINNLNGYSNLPFYTIDGRTCVDYIAKYENLSTDIKYIFERIGLSFDEWLPFEKKGVRPKDKNLKNMYNKNSIQKMEDIFNKEIFLFNYKSYL